MKCFSNLGYHLRSCCDFSQGMQVLINHQMRLHNPFAKMVLFLINVFVNETGFHYLQSKVIE